MMMENSRPSGPATATRWPSRCKPSASFAHWSSVPPPVSSESIWRIRRLMDAADRSLVFPSPARLQHAQRRAGPDLAPEFETLDGRGHSERSSFGDIPVIELRALDEPVAPALQVEVRLPVEQVIFHQEQRRAMACHVQAFEHIQLQTLHINADEINTGMAAFGQHLVQSENPHGFLVHVTCPCIDTVGQKRRVLRILTHEQVRRRRMTRRAARNLKHQRTRSRRLERFVETEQRFDEDTAPATLFQKPRLGTVVRIVRPNLDKKAFGFTREKFPDEFPLAGLRIHLDCRY